MKKKEKKCFIFVMPPKLRAYVDWKHQKTGISRSDIVREALKLHIDQFPQKSTRKTK